MTRPLPDMQALLSLSIEFGNRHFGTTLVEVKHLEVELTNWLFDDRRAPVWRLLSKGLITEREARDLLLQKIFDYYRITLSRTVIKDGANDPAEDEPFDRALFGRAARDCPPPVG
jgi:hypothetical protein